VETRRLEAFSDGVLAIAITLLILDVKVPAPRHGSLLAALGHEWPSYAAYVVSFLTIGIMWVNHHALFDHVRRADRALLFWNVGLLLTIAFLPFPTSVLARYVRSPAHGSAAAFVYSATLAVIGLGYLALWRHLRRHPELLAPEATQHVVVGFRRTLAGPSTYAIAAALAWVSPYLTLVLCAGLAVYFVFPGRVRPP